MMTDARAWVRRREALGRHGEELAAAYLVRAGMRILARNWRCAAGEIDIVARHGGTLVIAEVKTRASLRFGTPLEAVSRGKRQRLRRLARLWAAENATGGVRTRIDAVAVLVFPGGRSYIKHRRGVA
ncbi:YraN family protein [Allosalinactinospora lopnorensis]|uniref:YraN family protein n=1 Tax=Allosalinactinospora lopnorensis TaxID=1352348 RepID=UPI000623D0A8|nr:YraN family protein [Allosalinactinospora lopnorensis]